MTHEQLISKLERGGIEYILWRCDTATYVEVGRFGYRFEGQGNGWLDQALRRGLEVGMGAMGGPVDRAYLVSVDDLREICSGLTDGKREYKLICDDEKTVAISYNDGRDDLNSICFTFPIVANLNFSHGFLVRLFGKQWPFGEDGLMVCLHVYTKKQIRRGLYLEDEKLKWDGIEDWQKFWEPLEAALIKGMECRSR